MHNQTTISPMSGCWAANRAAVRFAVLALILMHVFCLSASAQESLAGKELEAFKQELKKRYSRDQEVRWDLINYSQVKDQNPDLKMQLLKTGSDVDGDNVKWLRRYIRKFGWPSSSELAKPERDQFFVLVLHADRDRKFQKKCLKLMKGLETGQWSTSYHRALEARLKTRPPAKVKLPAK